MEDGHISVIMAKKNIELEKQITKLERRVVELEVYNDTLSESPIDDGEKEFVDQIELLSYKFRWV